MSLPPYKPYIPKPIPPPVATHLPRVIPNKGDMMDLFSLAESGDIDKLMRFASTNISSYNLKNDDGDTVIHIILRQSVGDADEDKLLKSVKFFANKGTDLGASNKERVTALHLAAKYQYPKIVEYLVDGGVDSNVKDIQFMTPLHYAALGNITEMKKPKEVGSLIPKDEEGIKKDLKELANSIFKVLELNDIRAYIDQIKSIIEVDNIQVLDPTNSINTWNKKLNDAGKSDDVSKRKTAVKEVYEDITKLLEDTLKRVINYTKVDNNNYDKIDDYHNNLYKELTNMWTAKTVSSTGYAADNEDKITNLFNNFKKKPASVGYPLNTDYIDLLKSWIISMVINLHDNPGYVGKEFPTVPGKEDYIKAADQEKLSNLKNKIIGRIVSPDAESVFKNTVGRMTDKILSMMFNDYIQRTAAKFVTDYVGNNAGYLGSGPMKEYSDETKQTEFNKTKSTYIDDKLVDELTNKPKMQFWVDFNELLDNFIKKFYSTSSTDDTDQAYKDLKYTGRIMNKGDKEDIHGRMAPGSQNKETPDYYKLDPEVIDRLCSVKEGFQWRRVADVNAQDSVHNTPLFYAIDSMSIEVIKKLVDYGASTGSIKNKAGFNPLEYAYYQFRTNGGESEPYDNMFKTLSDPYDNMFKTLSDPYYEAVKNSTISNKDYSNNVIRYLDIMFPMMLCLYNRIFKVMINRDKNLADKLTQTLKKYGLDPIPLTYSDEDIIRLQKQGTNLEVLHDYHDTLTKAKKEEEEKKEEKKAEVTIDELDVDKILFKQEGGVPLNPDAPVYIPIQQQQQQALVQLQTEIKKINKQTDDLKIQLNIQQINLKRLADKELTIQEQQTLQQEELSKIYNQLIEDKSSFEWYIKNKRTQVIKDNEQQTKKLDQMIQQQDQDIKELLARLTQLQKVKTIIMDNIKTQKENIYKQLQIIDQQLQQNINQIYNQQVYHQQIQYLDGLNKTETWLDGQPIQLNLNQADTLDKKLATLKEIQQKITNQLNETKNLDVSKGWKALIGIKDLGLTTLNLTKLVGSTLKSDISNIASSFLDVIPPSVRAVRKYREKDEPIIEPRTVEEPSASQKLEQLDTNITELTKKVSAKLQESVAKGQYGGQFDYKNNPNMKNELWRGYLNRAEVVNTTNIHPVLSEILNHIVEQTASKKEIGLEAIPDLILLNDVYKGVFKKVITAYEGPKDHYIKGLVKDIFASATAAVIGNSLHQSVMKTVAKYYNESGVADPEAKTNYIDTPKLKNDTTLPDGISKDMVDYYIDTDKDEKSTDEMFNDITNEIKSRLDVTDKPEEHTVIVSLKKYVYPYYTTLYKESISNMTALIKVYNKRILDEYGYFELIRAMVKDDN